MNVTFKNKIAKESIYKIVVELFRSKLFINPGNILTLSIKLDILENYESADKNINFYVTIKLNDCKV